MVLRRRRAPCGLTMLDVLVLVPLLVAAAALFLPFLWGQREKARRVACMNNLNQVGKAMESYCVDYAMYFPCWPGWGAPSAAAEDGQVHRALEKAELGLVSDNRIKGRMIRQTLCPGKLTPTSPVGPGLAGRDRAAVWWGDGAELALGYGLRVIAKGQLHADPGQKGLGPGNLNTAARGLGFLPFCGYLPDPQVFYCPSAEDMKGDLISYAANERQGGIQRRDQVRKAGAGPQGLFYGDLREASGFCSDPGVAGGADRGVLCSYNYRNQEVFGAYTPLDRRGFPIPFTKPAVRTVTGAPSFKTQKFLAARLIVVDTFSRSADETNYNLPGRGAEAHQEGYCALYGDYHVSWYGDPQARLIWWGVETADSRSLATAAWYGTQGSTASAASPEKRWNETSHSVFHHFDMAAGIDVDAQGGW